MANKKRHHVLFWMKSSRGTDIKTVRAFKGKPSDDEIKDHLESWANRQSAMQHSDNYVRYGYRRITVPPRRELLQRWDRVCKRFSKAKAGRDTVAAMLNVIEVE